MRDHHIHNPIPQHMKDLIHWFDRNGFDDRTRMLERKTTSPSGRDVVVLTYPTEEDIVVSGSVNSGKGWERESVKQVYDFWSSVGQRKGNFLDCGANIGTWSLPMAVDFRGTQSKVISIEAVAGIVDHLRAGILANAADNVVLYPYGVGEPLDNRINISIVEGGEDKASSAVLHRSSGIPFIFLSGYTTVDAILDVEPAMKNIVAAKIDLAGYEEHLVNGAQTLFSKHPPCMVIIELRNDLLNQFNSLKEPIISQFLTFGYELIGNGDADGTDKYVFHQKDMAACVARLS